MGGAAGGCGRSRHCGAADRRRVAFLPAGAIPPAATAGAALRGATLFMRAALGVGARVEATILAGRAIAPIHQGFPMLWDIGSLRRTAAQVERYLQTPAAREPAQWTVSRRFHGALRVCRVVFRYPGAPDSALSGVDAAAPEGGFIAITCPSGADQATLLRVMAGLQAPGAAARSSTGSICVSSTLRSCAAWWISPPTIRRSSTARWRSTFGWRRQTALTDRLSAPCEELGLADGVAGMEDGLDKRLTHEGRRACSRVIAR